MKAKTGRHGTGTTTSEALLGILSIAPMSGYDMRATIERSIGNFWNESFGQIYPALKRLTEEKLVEKKAERRKGHPDRNVYSLTAKGEDRVREWLEVPAANEVPRNELLLKLFFGGHAPVSASRESVESFVTRQQQALKRYREIAKQIRKEHSDDPRAEFWLMTVDYGRHYSEAMVKWGRKTLKELDAIESRAQEKSARKKRRE
ncbi:MAG TPA: PadR family transcriptional regulator [Edaphobacter sp.]